jgi:sugar-specific transcriptional regulator TrmB
MDIISILEQNGLSEKEAKVYLAMLELKDALPSTISRKTGVKRPTTYVILEALAARGLASRVDKKGLTYYQALDPRILIEDQYTKYKSLEKTLPELLSLHRRFSSAPQMRLFEGKEGLIKIMEDTLTTKTPICNWTNADLAATTILADYYPTYIRKKVAKKVWVNAILGYDKRALDFKKYEKEELREVHLIPKDKFPFKNEICIYENKVAILSHLDAVGVIIENANIADTQRSIFNFGFEYAKILEEKLLTAKDFAYLKGA